MTGNGEVERLRAELERQRRLVAASEALHSTIELGAVLETILATATGGVMADRGTVFLLSRDGKELWSRVLQGDEALEIRLPVGQGIAGEVARSGKPVRIADAYEDERFDKSWDLKSGYRTRQVLCAPIRNRSGKVVGVFQLLNRKEGDFGVEDERFLASLSTHAALAVENALLHETSLEKERQEREILLAQGVQRNLLPEHLATRHGPFSLAWMNQLCEDASGDYYDHLPKTHDGRTGVALGDVSGHGLPAAFVMAEARAFLRAFAQGGHTLPRMIELLNEALCEDLTEGRFLTLFTALLDRETGAVEWVSAGHNPALVYSAAKDKLRELPSTGPALGILPGLEYPAGPSFRLEPGDVLLAYTDGVTEAKSPGGEMFELERLSSTLKAVASFDPPHILKAIADQVTAWIGGGARADDVTLMAVKWDGE